MKSDDFAIFGHNLDLLIKYLHRLVHKYSIRNLRNGFYKTGTIDLIVRKGGSEIPEQLLSKSRQVAQWEPEYSRR